MATEHPPYSEPWEPLRVPTVAITHGLAVLAPDVDDPDEAADEEELPDEQALAPSPTSAPAASSIANDRDRDICRRLMCASFGEPALVSTTVRYAHVTCII
jgi:hypothetical protein